MAKKNKWTYHVSHSFKDADGKTYSALTQLYQVGVYMIVNGDPSMQMNLEPKQIASMEKRLLKQAAENKISDLTFGREITVSDASGLFEEIK